MATLNLGRIKPVFRGAYNGATAYVVDDIVTSSDETFICILASTGNATSNATYWTKLAAKGTDLTSTLTTEGDIVYKGASALTRLAKGSAAQQLAMNAGATAPEWVTASSGGVVQVKKALYTSTVSVTITTAGNWYDVSGITLDITPTSASNVIMLLGMFNIPTVTSSNNRTRIRLLRDSTPITTPDSVGSRIEAFHARYHTDAYETANGALVWWDTPATDAATTYKVQMSSNSSSDTGYLNRSKGDADTIDYVRSVSSLVAIELASGVL